MRLVIVSIIVSTPVAYYVMTGWLQGFEYHIGIEWWMFAIAASGAILLAVLTISFQAIKTARKNPVNSLRAE